MGSLRAQTKLVVPLDPIMRLIVTLKIKIRIISHSIFQLCVLQGGLRLDLLHLQQPAFNHSNHFFHSTQRSPEQTEEDEATSLTQS